MYTNGATLSTEFSYKSISALIKSKSKNTKIIDSLDFVAGALLVLTPVALGPAGAFTWSFLGAKNEATKSSKEILSWLSNEDAQSSLTRHERLSAAYCMSCYAAFFEAIDLMMPELHTNLALTPQDHFNLTNQALGTLKGDDLNSKTGHDDLDFRIKLPHPNNHMDESAEQLAPLYKEMAAGFGKLITHLSYWDQADEQSRDHVRAAIDELPSKSVDCYKAIYISLCTQYNEFYVWANLLEHSVTRNDIHQLSHDIRIALDSAGTSDTTPDVGFQKMRTAIAELITPVAHEQRAHNRALSALRMLYNSDIEGRVIDDSFVSNDEVALTYPKKINIFIPQSFQTIRYLHETLQLEDEGSWTDSSSRDDIGSHLLTCLASPYSMETPIIVLGQPGSGKSFLTQMLAARLGSNEYNPIRIELRDINPESDLQTQIEQQIRRDTGYSVNWAELAEATDGRPPLIILDGYDELLQATGKVFSSYLTKVASFQNRERTLGRPLRVIVTSRITLIDKAEIPIGSVIARLEDFDSHRQDLWVEIWNSSNEQFYRSQKIAPFTLPTSEELTALAKQPLLLLMLALYDSDRNALSSTPGLDQSVLYSTLLERFVMRERNKGEAGTEFRALSAPKRKDLISADMDRLRIAAIGMLNRRAVSISKQDLQDDLTYFNAIANPRNGSGGSVDLNQAELLLGSFFFVHESKSRVRTEKEIDPSQSAFEFLHNTFGEFLAADWLVRLLIQEIEILVELQGDPQLKQLLRTRLEQRDGLPDAWFATLMTTPLYTRPVVLTMLRQWISHALASRGKDVDEFAKTFDIIIFNQVGKLLSDAPAPDMLLGTSHTPYTRHPILTNMATYVMNLVVLRCVIAGRFVIPFESLLAGSGVEAWRTIYNMWHAGLGREGLTEISSVLSPFENDQTSITLIAKDTIASTAPPWGLQQVNTIAACIGDLQTEALSAWAMQDSAPGTAPSLSRLSKHAESVDSMFHEEVYARLLLRLGGEQGVTSLVNEYETTHKRIQPTTSGYSLALATPVGKGITSSELLPSHLVNGNAENLNPLWPRLLGIEWDKRIDLERMVFTRPIVCADILAWRRDRINVTGNASKGESRQLFGQSDMINFSDKLFRTVKSAASRKGAHFVPEIRYEVLSTAKRPASVDRLLLGSRAPIYAIANRPRSTLMSLLSVSQQVGLFGWLDAITTALNAKSVGAPLVRTLGGPNTLAILRHAARRTHLPSVPSVHGLAGIVDYCIDVTPPDHSSLLGHELALLHSSSTPRWLDALGVERLSPQHPHAYLIKHAENEASTVLTDLRELSQLDI